MNNLNGHKHIPLGYTRTLIGKTFIKTLIDSGNLFGTICSEKLAKQLNLSVSPCSLKAGTAVAGQPVEVLGKVKPFFIIIEDIEQPVLIEPIVVRNLSHDLNLGEAFLRGHNASLTFNKGKVNLGIGNSNVNLLDKNVPLIRNSDDVRFSAVMRADKAARQQKIDNIEHLNISESAFSTKTVDKGTIGKNSLGFVKVKSNISSGIGYFASKENSNFLNSNNLVALSGIFTFKEGCFNLPICNLGEKDVTIPGEIKIGKVHPAVQSVSSGTVPRVSDIHPTVQSVHKVPGVSSGRVYPGVHVLDHGPENKHNRLERETFLKEQLKLSETVLNESQQKEVLEIFLRNFDACSVNARKCPG